MSFSSIRFKSFRNLADTVLDVSYPEIFLVGKNGQGKTNLLEAIYLLSYGSSFRTKRDSEIYRRGGDSFWVSGSYKQDENISHTITVYSASRKKEITKNAKKITDRKELISTVPCIVFCHSDIEFAKGEMLNRRFFLDQTLTLCDAEYVERLRTFNKVLKTRNAILKNKQTQLLDAVDIQLAQAGLEIQKRRMNLVDEINGLFTDAYAAISGISDVRLEYRSSWKVQTFEEAIAYLLETRQRDIEFSITMSGPQRDKIHYLKEKSLFVQHASTGQIRLISLVLRAVQAQCYAEKTKRRPVLLLDDVLLELDPEKKVRFTELLPEYDQLFCTFLPGEPIDHYRKSRTKVYQVEEGKFFNE